MSKNLLVLGSKGFVGSNLLPLLKKEQEYSVIPVKGKSEIDLTNSNNCDALFQKHNPYSVINLCAKVGGIEDNIKHPGQFFYQNMATGLNIIHAAYKQKIQGNFIQLGTICCYPKNAETPYREDMILNGYPEPTNEAYAYAKRGQLNMLQAYSKEYGFNFLYLVSGSIYGPFDNFNYGQAHVIPSLFRKFIDAKKQNKKEIILLGSGNTIRDFLYVEDLAKVIIKLMNVKYAHPINISSGTGTKIIDIAVMIRQVLGFNDIEIKLDLSKPDGQFKRELDTSKLKSMIEFSPTPIFEGLKKTAEYVLEKEKEWI